MHNRSIEEIGRLGLETDHGTYARGRFYSNDFSSAERALLDAAGFTYQVEIADVSAYYADLNREAVASRTPDFCDAGEEGLYPVPANFSLGSMAGFYTYEEMEAILLDMQQKYPNLIHGPDTIPNATTIEGRPIYWLRISDNPAEEEADEPEILYDAVHHAREPASMTQLIFYMWYVLENYDTDEQVKYLVDESAMYFIPCVNPDGYIYNQTTNPNGGGLWRKNRHPNEDGSIGVDLNRNYGFEWGFDNSGSSPTPASDVYRGTGPFSEPETQAVREFCQAHNFRIALNYHTHGDLLIYPWGHSDEPTPDSVGFTALSQLLASRNNYLTGTGTETVGYTVNGDSDDWMYGEEGEKPSIYSLTPEVGDAGFWPPMSRIIPQCQGTVFMNLAAVGALHRQAGAKQIDDAISTATIDSIRLRVQLTGLDGGPITVQLAPVSNSTIIVDDAIQVVDLVPFAEADVVFPIDLAGISPGEDIRWLVTLDNGNYLTYDTLSHLYLGDTEPLVLERYDNLLNWENVGATGWFLTDEQAVSAPFSFTDSPFSDSAPDAAQRMRTRQPLVVPADAALGYVFFQARWDIEKGFDYTQLHLIVNETLEIPLCGKYSVAGSNSQATGEPLWDGQQEDWVQEGIDISDYITPGDELRFQFGFFSDSFVEGDGFYVDDFSVHFLATPVSATTAPTDLTGRVVVYPQPADEEVTIRFVQAVQSPITYQLLTITGQTVAAGQWAAPAAGESRAMAVDRLPTGLYILRVQAGTEWLGQVKVLVE